MKISEFVYTPNGCLSFIDNLGKNITDNIICTFENGDTLNSKGNGYISIPDRIFGEHKIYLMNNENETIEFSDRLKEYYFTYETAKNLFYVLLHNNYLLLGIYPNNNDDYRFESIEADLSFYNSQLGVKFNFKVEFPYFFKIEVDHQQQLVNFKNSEDNQYLLDLDGINLDYINKIYLVDYKFQSQKMLCLYDEDRSNKLLSVLSKSSKIHFKSNGELLNPQKLNLIGQLGKKHFSMNGNFKLSDSLLKIYRTQEDQELSIFTIENECITKLDYTADENIPFSDQFYLFKQSIINLGYRKSVGNIKENIQKAVPIDVKIEKVTSTGFDVTFEKQILTLQLVVSTNNYSGPFMEIESDFHNSVLNISYNNLLDKFANLGSHNGSNHMYIFANISFKGEKQAQFYRLKIGGENNFDNIVSFKKRLPLDGEIGKYHQFLQVFKKENYDLIIFKSALHNLVRQTYNWSAEIINIKRKNQTYELVVRIEGFLPNEYTIKSMRLIHRNVLNPRENNYPVEIKERNEGITTFTTSIDLFHDYVPYYWDTFVVIGDDNIMLPIQVNKLSDKIKKLVDVDVFEKEIRSEQNTILYPYVTAGGSLAFTYRNVESYENETNFNREIKASNLYNRFKKYFDSKNIWIVFEKNSFGAHDNAFHFFKYMYEHEKHPNTYYVIRKDSPEYHNLDGMHDRVLEYMSFKYFVYMFAAQVFISSDTKFHAYNLQRRDSLLAKSMMTKKNVFLQHGMNGIKKVPVFHKNRGLLDLIIAPSNFEKEKINIAKWGYSEDEVVATGYARWDSYVDKTSELPYHQIFMMPTWRKSMEGMTREQFVNTDFYKEYQSFLKSPKLKETLIKNNTRLAFFLHPYFKEYVELFDIDDSFTDKYGYLDVDMGEEIMKSSMMISDYSSVVWDMFYLEKPVMFYQFDQTDYLKSEGAYLDYDTDLFGDVVFNSQQAVNVLIKYVENGFEEEVRYAKLRAKYMNFHDHGNAERIYKAILKKKNLLGIENRWTLGRKILRKFWKIKKKIRHYNSNAK
ncbi:CDP-glycerol glycerophosphotransferase family protein [Weissella hellenica]|nr:CDP-glycerol glycerophosphotransferase family protein [Weissella hellenica]